VGSTLFLTLPPPLPLKRTDVTWEQEEMQNLGYFADGGGHWTVPELLFERQKLIPALQQLLIADRP